MISTSSSSLSQEGQGKLFSSCVACLIVGVHQLFDRSENGVFYAMCIFLTYLLIDYFCLNRSQPLTIDVVFHHIVGIFIVLFGLYELHYNEIQIYRHVSRFLDMEITTPFLHVSWILYNDYKNKTLAIILFGILLILWVPFRLLYPTKAVFELFLQHESFKFSSQNDRIVGFPFFACFILLQYYWFLQLCKVVIKKITFNQHNS